jgi:excisionase family DNA binding protein
VDTTIAPPSPLLTVPEVAAKLRISRSAVYTLINQRELETVVVFGRVRRILDASVDAYIERQRLAS